MKCNVLGRIWPILLAIVLHLVPLQAVNADDFSASFDQSSWIVQKEALYCELNHSIPGFGVAQFSQQAGKKQQFVLHSTLDRLQAGKARVELIPPEWSKAKSKSLGEIDVVAGRTPIKLTKMTSYQILEGMVDGFQTRFVVKPSNITTKDSKRKKRNFDSITLNPMGFSKGYNEYLACIDQMVSQNFDELRFKTVRFENNSTSLTRNVKAELDQIIKWVNADPNVYRIYIEGHSDSIGKYMANRELSFRRMWSVKDYMVFNGVNPRIFELKGYGSRKPLAKNNTKKGRALNRRVEVRLFR